jgi:hypothetical protein
MSDSYSFLGVAIALVEAVLLANIYSREMMFLTSAILLSKLIYICQIGHVIIITSLMEYHSDYLSRTLPILRRLNIRLAMPGRRCICEVLTRLGRERMARILPSTYLENQSWKVNGIKDWDAPSILNRMYCSLKSRVLCRKKGMGEIMRCLIPRRRFPGQIEDT